MKLKLDLKLKDPDVTCMNIYVAYTQASSLQLQVSKKTPGSRSYEGSKTGRICCILVLCLIYCKTACSGMESDSPVGSKTGLYAGVRGFDPALKVL